MLFVLLISLLTNINAVNIDLNSDQIGLSLMGDLEGRSIILKVKDNAGKTIATFKPTSGSTFYRGEFASFRLAEFVGLGALYPQTEIAYLTPKTQNKVKALLENVKYDKDYGDKHQGQMTRKEENRVIILEEMNRNIETNKNMNGALKLWITDIQFYKPLGSKIGFRLHPVYKYIKASGPQPPHKMYTVKQCTQLLEPKGCMSGIAYLDQLTKDMSSIMLLDAVIGNGDRFPGGNVHFKLTGKAARLFSLDNGAVLRPGDTTSLDTLKEFGISRFVKQYVDKLRALKDMSTPAVMELLGLAPEDYEIFKVNLNNTLKYVDELQKKFGNEIWFKA